MRHTGDQLEVTSEEMKWPVTEDRLCRVGREEALRLYTLQRFEAAFEPLVFTRYASLTHDVYIYRIFPRPIEYTQQEPFRRHSLNKQS